LYAGVDSFNKSTKLPISGMYTFPPAMPCFSGGKPVSIDVIAVGVIVGHVLAFLEESDTQVA